MAQDSLRLTEGERLLITRLRSEFTQAIAAKLLGMSRNYYGELERDAKENVRVINCSDIFPLQVYEKCLLLRRRKGETQDNCAAMIGITRYWYNLMENGKANCDLLAKFWGVSNEDR